MKVDIPSDSNCCSEPVSYAAVEEDCTCGLVIEVFDYSDKVGADVVLLHGCLTNSLSFCHFDAGMLAEGKGHETDVIKKRV